MRLTGEKEAGTDAVAIRALYGSPRTARKTSSHTIDGRRVLIVGECDPAKKSRFLRRLAADSEDSRWNTPCTHLMIHWDKKDTYAKCGRSVQNTDGICDPWVRWG